MKLRTVFSTYVDINNLTELLSITAIRRFSVLQLYRMTCRRSQIDNYVQHSASVKSDVVVLSVRTIRIYTESKCLLSPRTHLDTGLRCGVG
jgi:hypothetical protein